MIKKWFYQPAEKVRYVFELCETLIWNLNVKHIRKEKLFRTLDNLVSSWEGLGPRMPSVLELEPQRILLQVVQPNRPRMKFEFINKTVQAVLKTIHTCLLRHKVCRKRLCKPHEPTVETICRRKVCSPQEGEVFLGRSWQSLSDWTYNDTWKVLVKTLAVNSRKLPSMRRSKATNKRMKLVRSVRGELNFFW